MEFSNIEEDSFEAQRRERRERMKEEKRRQAAKRAMLKKMVPLLIVAVIAVAIIVGTVVWGIRALFDKHKGNESEEIQTQEVTEPESLPVDEEPQVKKLKIDNMLPITVNLPQMFEGYRLDTAGADVSITEEEVQSQYATLIDATSGKVLVTRNGSDRMTPASMTKVMTVLVACEHITDLEDPFTITVEDTDYAYIHDLSIAGFEADEIVPIKDILYGAIMPSGGECCHALERYVAGDEEEFVRMMNDKAAELGLTGTHFTNSAGLYGEDHYTTLYDMSMIMKAAIENDICRQVLHEHIHVTQITDKHPEGIELSNWFMRRIEDKYTKTEVMGAKTGYVVQSGNCAVSYTIGSDGRVYICATGNAHSAWRAIFDHVALYEKYVE